MTERPAILATLYISDGTTEVTVATHPDVPEQHVGDVATGDGMFDTAVDLLTQAGYNPLPGHGWVPVNTERSMFHRVMDSPR